MVLNSYFLDMQKMHVNVMVIFSCSYILNSQTDSWYYFSTLKTKVDIYEILKPVFPVLFKYIASSMYPLSS